MNEPLEAPLFSIMAVATMMFSPPLSPLTRQGQPHTSVDLIKPERTVSGKLFAATPIPVTFKTVGKSDLQMRFESDWMRTHRTVVPVNRCVDDDTPRAKLMMAVDVPYSIGSG